MLTCRELWETETPLHLILDILLTPVPVPDGAHAAVTVADTPEGGVSALVTAGHAHTVIKFPVTQMDPGQVVLETVKILQAGLSQLPLGVDGLGDFFKIPQTLSVLSFGLCYLCLEGSYSGFLTVESFVKYLFLFKIGF